MQKKKSYKKFPLTTNFQITTSKSFKNLYCSNTKLSKNLRDVLEMLHLPKFIWLIQLENIENVEKVVDNQVIGLVIIDPVSPSLADSVLFQYFNGILQVNTNIYSGYNPDKQVDDEFLPRYTNNLKTF